METFGFRVNSGVLCPEPGEKLISTLRLWPSFRTKCSPHHDWLTRYGLLRNWWEERGWKRGVGLVMDDPFFWIKGSTKWMTSAWEWDTARVLFAQGWPQVNYAVTVTGGESHLNDVEEPREKPKEAETARWMTSPVNVKREGCHIEEVVVYLAESGCVSISGPQSNINLPLKSQCL